jgi:hypothetical protein
MILGGALLAGWGLYALGAWSLETHHGLTPASITQGVGIPSRIGSASAAESAPAPSPARIRRELFQQDGHRRSCPRL